MCALCAQPPKKTKLAILPKWKLLSTWVAFFRCTLWRRHPWGMRLVFLRWHVGLLTLSSCTPQISSRNRWNARLSWCCLVQPLFTNKGSQSHNGKGDSSVCLCSAIIIRFLRSIRMKPILNAWWMAKKCLKRVWIKRVSPHPCEPII